VVVSWKIGERRGDRQISFLDVLGDELEEMELGCWNLVLEKHRYVIAVTALVAMFL
jgi:hypothetical protein